MNKVSRLKFIIAAIVSGLSLVASVGGQDGRAAGAGQTGDRAGHDSCA
jgi:hypothetical protein